MPRHRLEVPADLHRNAARVIEAGPEETGVLVLRNVADVLGLPDLSTIDMLDVGCGVRFTQSIINRDIPIRSYCGVDVAPNVISWLQNNVKDPRFRYGLFNVKNDMYNKRGPPFTRDSKLPVEGRFNLICLFSVFTHLSPSDADAMLHVLRPHLAPGGKLLFTVFLDEKVDGFLDKRPDKPLNVATYSPAAMNAMIERNGWRLVRSIPRQKEKFVQHQLLCEAATATA